MGGSVTTFVKLIASDLFEFLRLAVPVFSGLALWGLLGLHIGQYLYPGDDPIGTGFLGMVLVLWAATLLYVTMDYLRDRWQIAVESSKTNKEESA